MAKFKSKSENKGYSGSKIQSLLLLDFEEKRGNKVMIRQSKRNFTIVFLSLILILGAYATLTPNVHAKSITTQQQEGLAISNEVVGLDLTKYQSAQKSEYQDFYLELLPQENVRYALESNGSKLDIVHTFVNGNLQKINVLENEGSHT
ncbi:MAG: hypothetical protein ACBZ72_04880 [Candidatus Bathyarchaeia archaeon]|jgi:hypothetical protein